MVQDNASKKKIDRLFMYSPRGEGKARIELPEPATTPRRKSRKEAKPRSNANARPTGIARRRVWSERGMRRVWVPVHWPGAESG